MEAISELLFRNRYRYDIIVYYILVLYYIITKAIISFGTAVQRRLSTKMHEIASIYI